MATVKFFFCTIILLHVASALQFRSCSHASHIPRKMQFVSPADTTQRNCFSLFGVQARHQSHTKILCTSAKYNIPVVWTAVGSSHRIGFRWSQTMVSIRPRCKWRPHNRHRWYKSDSAMACFLRYFCSRAQRTAM